MWQEVVSQVDIGAWNALCPKLLLESSVEDAFGTSIAPLNKLPDCNPLGGRSFSELNWNTAAGFVLSPPSLASEGSCTTSSSEYPGSPIKNGPFKATSPGKSEMMKHPIANSAATHIGGNERDAVSPSPRATAWWTSMLLRSTSSHSSPSSASAIPELDTLNWSSSNLSAPATCCDGDEQFSEIPSPSSVITADRHEHLGAACLNAFVGSPSTGSTLGGVAGSSIWSQVLLGGARSEAMQNLQNGSVEGLQDLLYSRSIRQGSEFLLSDQLKKFVEMPAWDIPPNSFTFRGDERSLPTLENPTSSLQYSQLVDDRFNSTSCGLSDIQTWSAAGYDHSNASISQMKSLNAFTSGLDLSSIQFQESHVKQEYPLSFSCVTPPTTSTNQLQGFGNNSFKSDGVSTHRFSSCRNMPFLKALAGDASLACPNVGEEFPGRYPSVDCSTFPPALPQPFPSGSMSKQAAQTLAFGSSLHLQSVDLSALMRPEVRHPMHGRITDRASPLQYVHGSVQGTELLEAPSNLRPKVHVDKVMDNGSDLKRHTALLNPTENPSEGLFKRPRVEPTSALPPPPPPAHASPTLPFKQVRKERLGDRITTLQQLVSPFGKTDTASVLLEAIGYIKFLQEQVQVLSTPYLKSTGVCSSQKDPGKKTWGPGQSQDKDESPKGDLRSRGLCLVPVSYTLHVANDNGADYWASTVGGSYR